MRITVKEDDLRVLRFAFRRRHKSCHDLRLTSRLSTDILIFKNWRSADIVKAIDFVTVRPPVAVG
jgi:hypothetical protein